MLHFLSHLFFPFFFLVQFNLSWGLSLIHFTHRIDSYSNSLLLLFFNSSSLLTPSSAWAIYDDSVAPPNPDICPNFVLLFNQLIPFTSIMRPEVEQELAHTLLVELLAYQFASPVRWIETQDVILAEQRTERIVEIGPADTLGGMARRTLASKYEAYDAATSVQRQILCYNKDASEIYYDVVPVEEEPEVAAEPASSGASAAAPAAAPAAGAPPPPPSAGPAASVEDVPVTAVDILRTLVAQKLKKSLGDVPLSKAIKDLVGGK